MSKTYTVKRIVHEWDEQEDRWLYLEYYPDNEIIGLNFMQGDNYNCFKKHYCWADGGLTQFYLQMLYIFPVEKASVNNITFINKCMTAYYSAISWAKKHEYIDFGRQADTVPGIN